MEQNRSQRVCTSSRSCRFQNFHDGAHFKLTEIDEPPLNEPPKQGVLTSHRAGNFDLRHRDGWMRNAFLTSSFISLACWILQAKWKMVCK